MGSVFSCGVVRKIKKEETRVDRKFEEEENFYNY